MRYLPHVFEVSLVLIKDSTEECRKCRSSVTFQHHPVELCGCLLLENDTNVTLRLSDDTSAPATFDVRFFVHYASASGGSSDEHLLWLVASFHTFRLDFINQVANEFGSFLIKMAKARLCINDALAADNRSTSVQLPLTVVQVLLDAGPSVPILLLH